VREIVLGDPRDAPQVLRRGPCPTGVPLSISAAARAAARLGPSAAVAPQPLDLAQQFGDAVRLDLGGEGVGNTCPSPAQRARSAPTLATAPWELRRGFLPSRDPPLGPALTVNVRAYRSPARNKRSQDGREHLRMPALVSRHDDSKHGRESAAHLVPPLPSTCRPGPRCRGDYTHGHGNPSPAASPTGGAWEASWSRGDLAPLPDHAGRPRRRPAGYHLRRYL